MKTTWLLSSLVLLVLVAPRLAEAQYTNHTGRGAALGGVLGALTGAAIGDHNDEAVAGALIGGAAGLITGAAIGNSMDEQNQLRAYRQQQAYVARQGVAVTDVLSMTRSGVSDEVIINHIRANGMERPLEVADVIALHQQGVREPVLTAMQRYSTPVRPTTVYARPVIVEEYHYVRPPVYGWGPGYHPYPPRPCYGPPGPRVSWGFSYHGH